MTAHEASRRRRRSRQAGAWAAEIAAWTVLLWGVWLLSLSAVGTPDLVVGGSCALGCGACAAAARRAIRQRWWPSWQDVAPAALLPVAVLVDTVAVLTSPLRPGARRGELQTVQVGAAGHGPRQAARRALVATIVSATPATVVLDVDDTKGTVVVHAMRSPGPSLQDRYARE